MKSIETTLREIENKDIAFTRLLYIDNDGVIRGQAAVGDQIEGVFKTGHSYALAMPFLVFWIPLDRRQTLAAPVK
ncbi:hypothetical protein N752_03470 [Desulforamulus aquiferis]|nr:hypothetical protein N752_03470 [Desulforamulus aquiferis]